MQSGSTRELAEPQSTQQKLQRRASRELSSSTLMESLLCCEREKRGFFPLFAEKKNLKDEKNKRKDQSRS